MNPAQAIDPSRMLDYDELYATYQRGLVEKLRGFGPEPAYLSLWVPDENPQQGLWNLFDAAASEGQTALCVQIERKTLGPVALPALKQSLACFGAVELDAPDDTLVIRIQELHPASAPRIEDHAESSARPKRNSSSKPRTKDAGHHCAPEDCYPALYDSSAPSTRRRSQAPNAPATVLRASSWLGELWLSITPDGSEILDAGYSQPKDIGAQRALEQLCGIAVQLPLREFFDHGVARAEFQLRAQRDARPVPGIVLPHNAHPSFAALAELIAALRHNCPELTQAWSSSYNEYDAGPSSAWSQLDPSARRERIEQVVRAFARAHRDKMEGIELLRIDAEIRVHVELKSKGPAAQSAVLVTGLERELRDQIEPRLELFLEAKRDQNKLRRLTVIPSPAASPAENA